MTSNGSSEISAARAFPFFSPEFNYARFRFKLPAHRQLTNRQRTGRVMEKGSLVGETPENC